VCAGQPHVPVLEAWSRKDHAQDYSQQEHKHLYYMSTMQITGKFPIR